MNTVYQLVVEDIAMSASGPMHMMSEPIHITTKLFNNLEDAKMWAEEHYGKGEYAEWEYVESEDEEYLEYWEMDSCGIYGYHIEKKEIE